MHLVLTGLNHKTAPVELRERLSVDEDGALSALGVMKERGAAEAAILSTCNRTEVYAVAAHPADARRIADESFAALGSGLPGGIAAAADGVIYRFDDEEAARHLFRVAAGLDSLVVGEAQVLGQVRSAYETAQRAGSAGPVLSQLFTKGVHVGKRVRRETRIGEGAVSISYAAVELARKIFDSLHSKRVLIVGAGKMAVLAAKNLKDQGVSDILVANRTPERSQALAAAIGGRAVPMHDLQALLPRVDIVITSTGARSAVITRDAVAAAMRRRKGEPLFLIDIAVPRDVDPAVHGIDGVFLYDIDDLGAVVQANLAERRQCVAEAERIIEQETARFALWMRERVAAPVITALREKVRETAEHEVERLLRRLDHLPDREKALVRALAHSIAGKLLHQPTMRLKSAVEEGTYREIFRTVSDLFGLDPSGWEPRAPGAGESRGTPS